MNLDSGAEILKLLTDALSYPKSLAKQLSYILATQFSILITILFFKYTVSIHYILGAAFLTNSYA